MNTVETIEKNKVKLTFSASPERFEEGLRYSYNKNKGNMPVQGFRKGKAPRKLLERQYGKEVFYDDAFNFIVQDVYIEALEESGIDAVSRPMLDVESANAEAGVVFTAEIFVRPEVEISDYFGVTYERVETEVTEDEVNASIDSDRDKNSRLITVTDRPAEDGDIVTLDFEGFIDGEAFEGGKASDYELTIGSKSFIDTFEEQLVGLNIGEKKEVNVTFPDNYGNEELQGKPAMFAVEIKEIRMKELPEADDDFAQDVSEFDTFEEYKEDVRTKLTALNTENAERERSGKVIEKLVEKAVIDVPEVMIEDRIDMMLNDFAAQMRGRGLSLEMYMQYTGMTKETMREQYRQEAENYVRGRLVLEEIAKREDIEVTEAEIDEEIAKMAELYGMDKEKFLPSVGEDERKSVSGEIKVQKALKLIIEKAIEA